MEIKFDISDFDKNINSDASHPSISLNNAIVERKASLETQLYNVKYKMFSKTKSVMELMCKNFGIYSKLASSAAADDMNNVNDALKKMTKIENLIEKDNEKIENLLQKIEKSYSKKEEKDKPRILQGRNRETIEKGLNNLLKFTKECVDMQKEIAISKTKKGAENSTEEASVQGLIEVFTFNEFSKFADNFLKSNVVKAYIKKRFSTTGKWLKIIKQKVDYYNRLNNQERKRIERIIMIKSTLQAVVNASKKNRDKNISIFDPRVIKGINDLIEAVEKSD